MTRNALTMGRRALLPLAVAMWLMALAPTNARAVSFVSVPADTNHTGGTFEWRIDGLADVNGGLGQFGAPTTVQVMRVVEGAAGPGGSSCPAGTSTAYSTTYLAAGWHSFYFYPATSRTNTGTVPYVYWTCTWGAPLVDDILVDPDPPAIGDAGASVDAAARSVQLRATATDALSEVASYRWEDANTGAAFSSAQNPFLSSLQPGTYTVRVVVTDRLGNAASADVGFIVPTAAVDAPIAPDVVPPTLPPIPRTSWRGSTGTIRWTASYDATGVVRYRVQRYNRGWRSLGAHAWRWQKVVHSGFSRISYRIRAEDAVGNVSAWRVFVIQRPRKQ